MSPETSIAYDPSFTTADESVYRAMFYGLGSDGTVGANKNSIKIIGDETDNYAQGYFVYDSKKAGSVTVSHLRFGKNPIRSPYLIDRANFIACHNPSFIEKYDMLKNIEEGGTFLLTTQHSADDVWDTLPAEVQKQIIDKKVKFYVIDAISLAMKLGLGARINMIMQTAFFKLSGILPDEQAIAAIKKAIKKTYGTQGRGRGRDELQGRRCARVANIQRGQVSGPRHQQVQDAAGGARGCAEFVKEVTAEIMAGRGDQVPVSKMPIDGRFPPGTTKFEKRNIAVEIPEWVPELCIQCGRCSLLCPHATIRMKAYDECRACRRARDVQERRGQGQAEGQEVHRAGCSGGLHRLRAVRAELPRAGEGREQAAHRQARDQHGSAGAAERGRARELGVLPVAAGDRSVALQPRHRSGQPVPAGAVRVLRRVRGLRRDPLCEAGEPALRRPRDYRKCDRLFVDLRRKPADHAVLRLARTACGPAWCNSLFEDNAEFGMGFRLTIDKFNEYRD